MTHISSNLLNLIKKFEGFEPLPYYCSAGVLTIGYGHAILPNESFKRITEPQALDILKSDIAIAIRIVEKYVTFPLTENQKDAITSLVFNWQPSNFIKSRGLKYLNQGDFANAKIEFFSKEKGVVNVRGKFSQGLYNRRQLEQKLFDKL